MLSSGIGSVVVPTTVLSSGDIKTLYENNPDTNAFTDTDKEKSDNITISQPVNLDDIESQVNNLNQAVVLKGVWDASTGSFPASSQAGYSYIVSKTGTVDSITFNINDRIVSILDNASVSTYANNWFKLDYTDQVVSVANKTGVIVLQSNDINNDTTNFNNILDSTDGDVQLALEKIDDHTHADNQISFTDNVVNNVSTTKHGYAPKGDGSLTKFLNASGEYTEIPSLDGGVL